MFFTLHWWLLHLQNNGRGLVWGNRQERLTIIALCSNEDMVVALRS